MTLPPGLQAVRDIPEWRCIQIADHVPELLDLIETLVGALEKYTERCPCEYNDCGYCQTHGCERPCKVEVKLAAMAEYREFK